MELKSAHIVEQGGGQVVVEVSGAGWTPGGGGSEWIRVDARWW